MKVHEIEQDIRLFRGERYEAVATAFAQGDQVLLVDALASHEDAERMRHNIEQEWRKHVRVVIVTHYMSDHVAGLRLFPEAEVVAHRYFMHTYLSQPRRSAADDEDFVAPTTLVGDALSLRWGRHQLMLFHCPGKTLCTVCIDVPASDLLLVGDNVVGNIVYLSSGAPELIASAVEELARRGRGRIVPGHGGVLPAASLGNARHYLARLRERVREARRRSAAEAAIRAIAIEECVAAGVTPVPFEREWHARNLDVVVERRLFTVDGFPESAWAPERSRRAAHGGLEG